MKPVIRYQNQLLFRKSYKPNRLMHTRSAANPSVTFRPMRRFGVKPQLELVSSKAEHPADNRKTQERYLPGRPS